jgi:hypothetical protein
MAAQGRIPGAAKIFNRWTFEEAALRAWVREREDEISQRSSLKRSAVTVRPGLHASSLRSRIDHPGKDSMKAIQRLLQIAAARKNKR